MSLVRVNISLKIFSGCLPVGMYSLVQVRQGRNARRGDSLAFGKNRVLSPVAAPQPQGVVISVERYHLFV
jgi:hypothetical protein